MEINFKIDASKSLAHLKKMQIGYNPKMRKAMFKSTLLIERDARINAPVGEGWKIKEGYRVGHYTGGQLRQSITHKIEQTKDDITGTVGSPLKYAKFVEEGTKAHTIKATRARILAFAVGASTKVFTKMVRHPGTKSQRPLRRALNDNKEGIISIIKQAINNLVR